MGFDCPAHACIYRAHPSPDAIRKIKKNGIHTAISRTHYLRAWTAFSLFLLHRYWPSCSLSTYRLVWISFYAIALRILCVHTLVLCYAMIETELKWRAKETARKNSDASHTVITAIAGFGARRKKATLLVVRNALCPFGCFWTRTTTLMRKDLWANHWYLKIYVNYETERRTQRCLLLGSRMRALGSIAVHANRHRRCLLCALLIGSIITEVREMLSISSGVFCWKQYDYWSRNTQRFRVGSAGEVQKTATK